MQRIHSYLLGELSSVSLCVHREESSWRRGGTEEGGSAWRDSRKEDTDREDHDRRDVERRDRDRRDDREPRAPARDQDDGKQSMI